MKQDISIVVIANIHREPLILPYLCDVQYIIHICQDYILPPTWVPKPEYAHADINQPGRFGAYRCFRGHQEALMKCDPMRPAIVLEDDAIPNREDWLEVCIEATSLLSKFDAVSLHSRGVDWNGYTDSECGKYLFPKDDGSIKWALGSLAYSIRPQSFGLITDCVYDGYPMDLFLANRMRYAIIKDSPLDHDRRYGSLVENPR